MTNVTVIGNGELVLYMISQLLQNGVNVTSLVTTTPLEGPEGITVATVSNDEELAKELESMDNGQYFVVAFYNKKIPANLVEKYKGRLMNVHASLLPEFKGADPIKDMLKAGHKTGGVTVHFVDEGYDTGPILEQRHMDFDLSGESFEQIVDCNYEKAVQLGAEIVANVLKNIDTINPKPQN
jgi:phosphoribosylglycinamide formyltransferase-1